MCCVDISRQNITSHKSNRLYVTMAETASTSSSDESSSSDYTTESSDEDGMETAEMRGNRLQLPQGLCERQDVFKEFFNVELWNSLSDVDKQHLQTFLPNFPEDDTVEKAKTLQRLFDFDTFKFSNPLIEFHQYLKAGYYRPDIAKMRRIIHRTEHREAKYRYQSFREQLKNEVLESQEKLLHQVRNLPPGVEPKFEKRKSNVDYVSHRTKKRYFQILSSIRSKTEDTDCSADENYPEGPPGTLSRKQKRHLNSIRNGLNSSKDRMFASTMIAKLNGFSIDLEKYITPNHNPFYINDESYKNLLFQHKKRKVERAADPEMNSKGISLSDIITRTPLPYFKSLPNKSPHGDVVKYRNHSHTPTSTSNHNRKPKMPLITHRKSPEIVTHTKQPTTNKLHPLFTHSSNSDSDSDSIDVSVPLPKRPKIAKATLASKPILNPTTTVSTPKFIKQEIKIEPDLVTVVSSGNSSLVPALTNTDINNDDNSPVIKVEAIENIDIMNTPIELENAEIDIMDFAVKPELMQDTHANFFSLIRDVICSTIEHRMNMYTLQERLKAWQENPISPLNDWYSYTDNWISILPSAITFLCGNASEQPDDFVPYMEYKTALDVYQWIGAGRDSDHFLSNLCNFWLEHRSETKHLPASNDLEIDVVDRDATPPPPRFPTNWTVRKATADEVSDYREQERRRYDNPHKAFTFRCNGYESVVGPLKGMYNPAISNTKARGHTMLNADRPNFVTILSLVRDATARLPNGEGTRADICELLKSSQYISNTAPDNILQSVVSGALDRMHTQWDPCVRYDQKRKIWIYLHRHRTEEDFERIHQLYQGVKGPKKPPTKKSPSKPKSTKTEKTPKAPVAKLENQVTTNSKEPPNSQQNVKTKTIPVAKRGEKKEVKQTIVKQEEEPVPGLVPTTQKGVSLLLSNHIQKHEKIPEELEEKSTARINPQVVKIRSPTQHSGKSLIIPTSNSQVVKDSNNSVPSNTSTSKHISQVVTQQLLQTIAVQQKQLLAAQQKSDNNEVKTEKIKVPVSNMHQQIIGITPQQLQNIKNVTLLRPNATQNLSLAPISSNSSNICDTGGQNIVTVAVSKSSGGPNDELPGVQIKTQGNLTPAQQQQILQTIKQKILPNAGVLNQQQQQYILKQKVGLVQVQKPQATGGASKFTSEVVSKSGAPSTGPVVAKVLTNAAGQVISVESLLAHQKQHGSLPQGTTLRVQGTKAGQQNIIQLTTPTSGSKSTTVPQFALSSQSNILTLTTSPKPTVAQTNIGSGVKTKTTSRGQQQVNKFPQKVAQQLINARILTSSSTSESQQAKLVQQSKFMLGQQSALKLPMKNSGGLKSVALSVGSGHSNSAIRMVNATNLNLTTIDGKPVLLASKGGTIQGQNVILQTQGSNASGPSLVLQNTGNVTASGSSAMAQQQANSSGSSINVINQQGNIVYSPQLKSQMSQQLVLASNAKNSMVQSQSGGQVMLGNQPLRLQTSGAGNAQRVVLASQGQGGQIVTQQILLPAGFQGTAINIKALQGVKVIPIAQAHGKGGQSRQVFARVMSPSMVKQSTTNPTNNKTQDNASLSGSD